MSTNKVLISLLRDKGYKPYAYSGRMMFGKKCVAVNLDSYADTWELALATVWMDRPKTDNMGIGIVAYWPECEWPEEDSDGLGR